MKFSFVHTLSRFHTPISSHSEVGFDGPLDNLVFALPGMVLSFGSWSLYLTVSLRCCYPEFQWVFGNTAWSQSSVKRKETILDTLFCDAYFPPTDTKLWAWGWRTQSCSVGMPVITWTSL